jgi:hypothetical protein
MLTALLYTMSDICYPQPILRLLGIDDTWASSDLTAVIVSSTPNFKHQIQQDYYLLHTWLIL